MSPDTFVLHDEMWEQRTFGAWQPLSLFIFNSMEESKSYWFEMSHFYFWWTNPLRKFTNIYKMYTWIVNVDLILHELLLSVLKIWMHHVRITSDALIMRFNYKKEYHIKVAVLTEAVRSSGCLVWPSTSVMSSFNCVCLCVEDNSTIHSRFHTRQTRQPPHPRTTHSLLHCCFIFMYFYLQICIIRQRELFYPDCIFLACLV